MVLYRIVGNMIRDTYRTEVFLEMHLCILKDRTQRWRLVRRYLVTSPPWTCFKVPKSLVSSLKFINIAKMKVTIWILESFLWNRSIKAGVMYHSFALFYQHEIVQKRGNSMYVLVRGRVKSPFPTIGESYASPNAPGNMMRFKSSLKLACYPKQESFYVA